MKPKISKEVVEIIKDARVEYQGRSAQLMAEMGISQRTCNQILSGQYDGRVNKKTFEKVSDWAESRRKTQEKKNPFDCFPCVHCSSNETKAIDPVDAGNITYPEKLNTEIKQKEAIFCFDCRRVSLVLMRLAMEIVAFPMSHEAEKRCHFETSQN